MEKIQIINSNSWFDIEKAEKFSEQTWWDGSNSISVNTNSQFDHIQYYITKSGKFIKNMWSNYQGSREIYDISNKNEFFEWLILNEYTPEDLNTYENISDILKKEYVM